MTRPAASQAVPVIDIGPWFDGNETARSAIAREVDEACTEWGFLIICGHRLDPRLMQDVVDVTRAFFDQAVEEKRRSSGPRGLGYSGFKSKSLARSYGNAAGLPDLKESFTFRTQVKPASDGEAAKRVTEYLAPHPWPERPAAMREIWQNYLSACDKLTIDLMHICARAVGVPENWFDDKIDRPVSAVVAQHYPALDASPEPGQLRSAPHTDFGTLTLLLTEDKPGGLQAMGTDGEWRDVKPVPNAFIVNLGDLMARWTNDRWRSTLHRVVNPPPEAGAAARRLSIVYFHAPNYDAVIECIPSCTDVQRPRKYDRVVAGEHLLQKVQQTNSIAQTTLHGSPRKD